ncbi:2og-fe oxygenase family [Fusarium mundagurra]|uniref:2og-fe oxygenase family n=1 Tax=Fusarium mundagurra TaxID=1567541 RepID=A0A8H6DCX0_9HYPO|nr:2og-fe oxygenase family [Fusarium mundagurra]
MSATTTPEQANLQTLNFYHGFFYLDLRDWESGKILKTLEDAWVVMKQWFDRPLEKKMQMETISDAHGFKPPGVQSGVNENTRDGFEALRISRVGLLDRSHLPDVVHENLQLFETLQLSAHFPLKTLLSRLSDAAGLKDNDRFEKCHPDTLPSKSTVFFIHHPLSDDLDNKTARGHNVHTDVGSFTLLFTEQPGLQVISPTTNKWEYIAAKPGHAIMMLLIHFALYLSYASDQLCIE